MFEVQTYTYFQGWVNCWSFDNGHGLVIPEQFKTYEDAKFALDEHLADIEDAVSFGDIAEAYDPSEFRIVQV